MDQPRRAAKLKQIPDQRYKVLQVAAVCVDNLPGIVQNHGTIAADEVVAGKLLLNVQLPDIEGMAAADQHEQIAGSAPPGDGFPLCVIDSVVVEGSVVIAADDLHDGFSFSVMYGIILSSGIGKCNREPEGRIRSAAAKPRPGKQSTGHSPRAAFRIRPQRQKSEDQKVFGFLWQG